MSALGYLIELRRRLILTVLFWFLITIPFIYKANVLYEWLAIPLHRHMPVGGGLIATSITTPFTVPLKLSLIVGLMSTMPFFLYQVWAFLRPALFKHEQRLMYLVTLSSLLLFVVGAVFAFSIVCPLALHFLLHMAPVGVTTLTDIAQYLDFVLALLFAFGLAFQTPLITWLLLHLGLVTPAYLRAKRPYIIVGAFTLGMVLTPPDVISQICLALPLWGLYELGLLCFILTQRIRSYSSVS